MTVVSFPLGVPQPDDIARWRLKFGLHECLRHGARMYVMGLDDNFIAIGFGTTVAFAMRARWRAAHERVAWAHTFAPGTERFARQCVMLAGRRLDLVAWRANKHSQHFQFQAPVSRTEVLQIMRPAVAEARGWAAVIEDQFRERA